MASVPSFAGSKNVLVPGATSGLVCLWPALSGWLWRAGGGPGAPLAAALPLLRAGRAELRPQPRAGPGMAERRRQARVQGAWAGAPPGRPAGKERCSRPSLPSRRTGLLPAVLGSGISLGCASPPPCAALTAGPAYPLPAVTELRVLQPSSYVKFARVPSFVCGDFGCGMQGMGVLPRRTFR